MTKAWIAMRKAILLLVTAIVILPGFSGCARQTAEKTSVQDSPIAITDGQVEEEAPPQKLLSLWVPTDNDVLPLVPESPSGFSPRSSSMPEEFYRPHDPGEYTVSVGDILEVSVFGHRDTLSHDIPVAPDGKLYYYFIDGVPASGRKLDDLRADLEERLDHLFATPEVSIIPKRVVSSKYVILGKVKGPGEYYLDSAITLRQAIGNAGGLAEGGYRGTSINIASLRSSFIIRNGERLPIDFEKLMHSEDAESDIYVRPGDYIYIASALLEEVYRLGAVYEERAMAYQDGMTLVGCITGYAGESGGYLPRAHIEEVLVIRGSLQNPDVMVVDLEAVLKGERADVYLVPGDIVYVPFKRYQWFRQLVRTAIFHFVRSFAGNAGHHYADEHWFD